MGTDIHIVIQRQTPEGAWEEIPYQQRWHHRPSPTLPGVVDAPLGFSDRNYDLFGILANVRNGTGFAGVQMGEGWPSIAADRGLPDDFDEPLPNPAYPEEGPRSLGDHNFTWIGLDELLAFDWDGTVSTLYGVVSALEYERLKGTEKGPDCYAGGTHGPGIVTYAPESYEVAKQAGTLAKKPHVRMAWTETARQATGDWPGTILPWLTALANGRPLRLVIGFGS